MTGAAGCAAQTYGQELKDAYDWLMKFKESRKEAELHQAWDLYYHVFKKINKQLHALTVLELKNVAPNLAGDRATVGGGLAGSGLGWLGLRALPHLALPAMHGMGGLALLRA